MSNKRTGNYDNYARLLNKYKTRHPAEIWGKESYKDESKQNRINEYLRMSEYIMDEMKLVGDQRRDVKYLIRNVPLKSLHGNIKAECIILCLCIYVKRTYRNFRWQEYKIVKDYNLTCSVLLTVVINLSIWYSRKIPLPFTENIDKYGTLIEEDNETETFKYY